ncbi:unnamed protein product [Rotaria sordida]|uniref:HAT C-terminal dimerisation domain-containing protein n=1 Tax=Rotaria sordida TaxID=392033 RepID=A0A815U5C7_9BILA|nr:unnamed protein product [Rotaria sordida]CAF1658736.1 unnamed protein product [Rotaria sordida]
MISFTRIIYISFLVVLGHAIIDGSFKSYVLGFVPLWGSHSGFLLLQKYQEIINIFGIKDKIIRLVNDNGLNNINAFKDLVIPGFEQYFTEDDNDDSNDEDSGNSQFLTVESILAIPTLELNEILIELKHSHLCLNVRDLAVLNELVALLSLLAEVTTTTQRDNSPSISLVAPSILAIYFDLKNEKNNIQHTTTLCNALISSLLSRFGGLLEQLEIDVNETGIEFKKKNQFYDLYKDPVFLFTLFLDGMFKLNWITGSFLPDAAKERICARIKKLIFDNGVIIEYTKEASVPVDIEPVQEEQVHGAESSSPSALKRKRLFSNIHNNQKYSKKTKSIDSNNYIKEEISRHLYASNNDNMILLKPTASNSYNTLAKLATKYLCIPATTATVERVFSQSGFLCRAHRARMSRKTLQQLTLLKCNCET